MSQPNHMSTYCNQSEFTRTSFYGSNRDTILATLRDRSSLGTYSNATTGLSPNTVYGMFLCRGDVNTTSCSDCVYTATQEIAKNCTYQKEAFVFYYECMVRYSEFSFFTLVEDIPYVASYSLIRSLESLHFFNQTLPGKIDELIVKASSSSSPVPYFVEDQERVTQSEGSYELEGMVQCAPDLDPLNCTVCLRLAVQDFFHCCSQSRWAQIFFPKCLVKYNISVLQPNVPSLGVTKRES
ncbi:unnamed protein product [Arabis nemorensis]|uniref:Gnk2-homologous domain-containing protein n=1 Tax=Arabis nemorensis TaxID=586526 RepID=A0A565B3C2_9BRAS|nr:unnamed protein product [Arabis nemorensis]